MRQSNVKRFIYAGFIGALVIMGIILYLSYDNFGKFVEADSWVEHTRNVQRNIDTLSLLLSDIQNEAHRFIITGDSALVDHRNVAIAALHSSIHALKDSVKDNPAQEENLRALDTISTREITITEQYFTIQSTIPQTVFGQISSLVKANELPVDSGRAVLNRMAKLENDLLHQRRERSNKNNNDVKSALGYGTGASFILLIVVFVFLIRDIAQRRRVQKLLEQSNEGLEHGMRKSIAELRISNTNLQEEKEKGLRTVAMLAEAQRLAKIGSWEMILTDPDDLNNNTFEWSEEVFRIFGYKPGKVNMSIEAFYRAMHPSDKEKVDAAIREYLNGGKRLSIDHRILHPDGTEVTVHEEGNILFDVRTRKALRLVGTIQDITEKRREEDTLRRMQQNLEEAQRIAHMGSWELDLSDIGNIDRNIVFASDEVLRIFGLPNGTKFLRKQFEEGIHPDDRNRRDKALYEYLAGGPPYNLDYRVIRPDGAERVVHSEGRLYYDEKTGTPLRLIGTMQDITERKREEEILRHSEASLAEAQRIAHLGSWKMDLSRQAMFGENAVTWSDEVYRIFGYEPGDIQSARKKFSHLVHPDDRGIVEKNLNAYLAGDAGESIDYRIIRADGTERTVHEEASIVRDENTGRALWVIGTIQDITIRMKMEKRLQQYYEQMKSIVENIDIVLLSLDMQNKRMIEISPACEKIYGYPIEAFIDDPMLWKKMVHPEDIQALVAGEARILSGNTSTDEYRIVRPDNSIRWIEERMKPTLDAEGNLVRLEGFIADITERKLAEDQIRGSLQEKEVLLKEVHHRVKNNMQVISSLLNLQGEYIRDSYDKELFRDSQTRVKSMALVHELLYQSKDLAQVNFRDYIRTIVEQLFSFHSVGMGKINLDIRVGDVQLGIDTAIPCGLIINELVSNALKYGFPGERKGSVVIDFSKEKDNYTCIVADDGVGLPANIEVENTSSLGLQLVHTLTRQLGGKLALDRNNGTRYLITFSE